MPRRHKRRHRTMRGGFLDSLSNTLSGWGTSLTQGASSIWDKTKNATSSLTNSTPTNTYSSPSYTSTPMTTSTYGGKHTRHKRRLRGGFEANTSASGLAVNAAPISGISTAKPHNLVGGKTKRRNRKGGKTRKHRKY